MKKLITMGVLVASLFVVVGCTQNPDAQNTQNTQSDIEAPPEGMYDEFAQCLTENEVVMYGTEWCPHCQDQKKMFGDAFDNVNYVDCDKERSTCVSEGVQGYPTWKDAQGNAYPGTQQLQKLGDIAGCELPA